MRFIYTLIIFLSLTAIEPAKSQGLPAVFEAGKILREDLLMLRSSYNNKTIDSLNILILNRFTQVLSIEESFHYTWPELDMIGKVKSADQKINVFTWNFQNEKGEHIYSGVIQQRVPEKRNKYRIIIHVLSDNSRQIKNPETQSLSPDNWLGALYYSITDFTYRRKTYYALLGFDFHSNFSNKKLIEILNTDKDQLSFGGEIKKETGEVRRMVFEYSSEIVMSLKYDTNLRKIVFDHLIPIEPVLRGVYRFYVPDGSYDALSFQKGEFVLLRDVDARNY